MAAGATYTPIATTTLGSNTASYTFSSIPSTYTDLILVATGLTSSATTTYTRVGNGSTDSGTNYSTTSISGNGSSALSYRSTNQNYIYNESNANWTTSNIAVDIIHFMNYANTSTYKTMLINSRCAASGADSVVGLWRSTSAINRIEFGTVNGGSYLSAGTTLTLYGIVAA